MKHHTLIDDQPGSMSLKSVGGGDTARAVNATAQPRMGSGGTLGEKSNACTVTSQGAPVNSASADASATSNCSAVNDLNRFFVMTPSLNTVDELLGAFYRVFPAPYPLMDGAQGEALVREWQRGLASLDDAEARAAARLWCSIGHRFPTPVDLLDCVTTLRAVQAIWPDAHFPPLAKP